MIKTKPAGQGADDLSVIVEKRII